MTQAPAIGSALPRLLQAAALACLLQPAAAAPLPGFGADPSRTSVSGISSGGYMAVQFHIAHSATGISLANTGYAYVPRGCESVHCRVHVAFHGCR